MSCQNCIDFTAGIFGGASGVLAGHPWDTIKVRLQNQHASGIQYKGAIDCFLKILREEKIPGLYRGMSSPLIGIAAINSVIFGVYGHTTRIVNESNLSPISKVAIAGAVSGFANSFICCPIELVKIRLQNQHDALSKPVRFTVPIYAGPIDCIKKVYKGEGVRGFYRGLSATIYRDIPSYSGNFFMD
jgi:solute carrier family 25 carnitine/acylcarnitine transporter 20/29